MSGRRPTLLVTLPLAAWLASAAAAHAQYSWNVDADANWKTPSWTGGPNPFPNLPGDSATFGGVIRANRTVTVDPGGVTVGSITFNAFSSYSLAGATGDAVTLDNGGGLTLLSAVGGGSAAQGTTTAGLTVAGAGLLRVENYTAGALGIGTAASTNAFNLGGGVTFAGSGNF